jgi:hypothetical protein
MKRLLFAFFVVIGVVNVAVCQDMAPVAVAQPEYVSPYNHGCRPWCGGKGKTPAVVAQPVYVAPYDHGCRPWCGGKGRTPVTVVQPEYVSPYDYGRAGR